MLYRIAVIAVVALALAAGCGAGRDTSGEATARESQATAKAVTTTPAAAATSTPAAPAAELSNPSAAAPAKIALDTSQLKPAPAWSLTDLEGNVVASDKYKGKVVIVDFWATWCGPCRRSIPDLIKLYGAYKDKGLEVIGVSLDQAGVMAVKPFVAQQKMNYPVLMGNQQIVNDFGRLSGPITGIPTAFIISRDGKVYKKYVGLYPPAVYEEDVKTLLGI